MLEELENPLQTIFFAIVGGCLFISLIFAIFGLGKYILLHIDPIEIIADSTMKTKETIAKQVTKALAFSWFKNQYVISKKNYYIRISHMFLKIGLLTLPFSLILSGLEI